MFCKECYRLRKASGMKGLTLYLKACQVLLQQSCGKYRVNDISDLKVRVKRNRSGIPIIIHRSVRAQIRSLKADKIQLWMTLFGLYRILEFKGTLKLSTILKPFTVTDKFVKE